MTARPDARFDSVLLLGYGGPTARDEVRPFLEGIVAGRNVPKERLDEVEHHYELLGGRSPFNELTFGQVDALRATMAASPVDLPLYIGMRFWHPFIRETIERMAVEGRRRAIGVVLAPHRTASSWEQYHQAVADAATEVPAAPEVKWVSAWHLHPLFIEALTQRVEEAAGHSRGKWPDNVPYLATAHSVPIAMAQRSHYAREVRETAAAVARTLGAARHLIAWQSRSGSPQTPWLEPDISDVLHELARRNTAEVVVQPIGFVSDHVEVLYDLDIEARQTAQDVGLRYIRAGTVGDHPAFIQMLHTVIAERAGIPLGN
jgi:protoporphyrin/coproporphyrin ferrochelatase